MTNEEALVRKIIKKHGAVINLENNPSVIIDIIRTFRFDDPGDGGAAPGGAPHPPPPTSAEGILDRDDVLKQVLKQVMKLSRDVAQLRKQAEIGR